ncbi:MAG: electron transporter, partial [Candidatus Omnitrophica bacterium]|nr:electron transporter [Candidatus Omnitrophota bacterium]
MGSHLTRPIYWNVEYVEPFIIPLGVLLVAAVLFGLYKRYQLWKALGESEVRWDRAWERFSRLLTSGLGQKKVARHGYAGTLHLLIFIGFVLLFIGTCLVSIERDIGQLLLGFTPVAFLYGNFYKVFSFVLDIAGVMVIVGCVMALYRRYVTKPKHLGKDPG